MIAALINESYSLVITASYQSGFWLRSVALQYVPRFHLEGRMHVSFSAPRVPFTAYPVDACISLYPYVVTDSSHFGHKTRSCPWPQGFLPNAAL